MQTISVLYKRELAAYFRSWNGYAVAALSLLVAGVLFMAIPMGRARLSNEALELFFMNTSFLVMIAGIALSVRLISEERASGTLVLLNTSPASDRDIVIAKFLAAFTFLGGIILLTLYMPLLLQINGKISNGQLVVGYIGLFMLGAMSLSLGIFASSLVKNQLLALVIGATLNTLFAIMFLFAKVLDPPFKDFFSQLDVWQLRFVAGPQKGILNLSDVVFYGAIVYFFLLLAVKTMGARRWR